MYEYMEYEYMDCVYEWARVHRSLQKVQGHRTAQGRSQRGRDSTHRRPCGTSPESGDPVWHAVRREVNRDTQGHLQNTQT